MAVMLQVRLEEDLKNKSDILFKSLGMDTTTAVRIFLTQAIAYEGFPFEIRKKPEPALIKLNEDEIIDTLEQSYQESLTGRYSALEDMVAETRNTYGL